MNQIGIRHGPLALLTNSLVAFKDLAEALELP
jgi:hypothetical protein